MFDILLIVGAILLAYVTGYKDGAAQSEAKDG